MKIVVLDGYALNPGDLDWGVLSPFGDVTVYDRTESEAQAVQRLSGCHIMLTNKFPITESLLSACPDLKLICVQATGYNIVDHIAARKRGIPVCNVPSYSTDSVAQLTFALLLELCHHVGAHDTAVHQGAWCESRDFCFWVSPLTELAGKTLGIIGLGSIGQAVARIGKAFGMEVLAYSRSRRPESRRRKSADPGAGQRPGRHSAAVHPSRLRSDPLRPGTHRPRILQPLHLRCGSAGRGSSAEYHGSGSEP